MKKYNRGQETDKQTKEMKDGEERVEKNDNRKYVTANSVKMR